MQKGMVVRARGHMGLFSLPPEEGVLVSWRLVGGTASRCWPFGTLRLGTDVG